MKKTFKERLNYRYNNLTLKYKLIFPTIIVLFVALLIFTLYLINDQRSKNIDNLREKSERVTFVLKESILESAWNYDNESIIINCDAVFKDNTVTKIYVKLKEEGELVNIARKTKGQFDIKLKHDLVRSEQNIGELEIVFTTFYIEQNIYNITIKLIILAAIIFTLIIFLIVLLLNIGFKPMNELMQGVLELTNGNLKYRVKIAYNDEIGNLATSFNNMSNELYNYTENLEEIVHKRTEELEKGLHELETANDSLISARDSLWGEMELAKRIQTVLVPQNPKIDNYMVSAAMYPADEVGGDYYDVINTGDIDWVVIGDVSGHGVSAGLIMMMVQTSIHVVVRNNPKVSPSELLEMINKAISYNMDMMDEHKYMTITVFAINDDGVIIHSGLHQDILVHRRDRKSIEIIETEGFWLGVEENSEGFFEDNKINMSINDVALLFTDGITEAFKKDYRGQINEDEMFGQEPFLRILKNHGDQNTETIKSEILKELDKYECMDDATFVILKRLS